MKPIGADPNADAAPKASVKADEKIDFSKVEIEPLFNDMVDLKHSQSQTSEPLRLKSA